MTLPRQPNAPQRPAVKRFLGLNNVEDPLNLGLKWFVQADNINITGRDKIERAKGYAQRSTNFAITGAYATRDQKRLYIVDAGELRQMDPDLFDADPPSYRVLATGLAPAHMAFEEIAGVVYATNGVDFLALDANGARAWGLPNPPAPQLGVASGALPAGLYSMVATFVDDRGLESGNSTPVTIALDGSQGLSITAIPQAPGRTTNVYLTTPNGPGYFLVAEAAPAAINWNGGVLGPEIPFWMTDPPRGERPALFKGALYVAEWFPEHDLTVIWKSLDLAYHHFDYAREAIAVPGHVLTLKATPNDESFLIGTERAIHSYGIEGRLTTLADYGVIPGEHVTHVHNQLYFWTERGLCRFPPFMNLSERRLSVEPGSSAAGTLIEQYGLRRYVVALNRGGTAYNRRTP